MGVAGTMQMVASASPRVYNATPADPCAVTWTDIRKASFSSGGVGGWRNRRRAISQILEPGLARGVYALRVGA